MEKATRWEIVDGLGAPCADISYRWNSGVRAQLVLTLHFSRVVDGFPNDLELTFKNPLALCWETESYGLIELPDKLPKCSSSRFSDYSYPSLIISDSKWADSYAARTHTEIEFKAHRVTHFAFIALNDLLHVLSNKKPTFAVVAPKA
jgi:hypothetical protein